MIAQRVTKRWQLKSAKEWTWADVEKELHQLQAMDKLAKGRIDERTAKKLSKMKTYDMLPHAFAEWYRLAYTMEDRRLLSDLAGDVKHGWQRVTWSYDRLKVVLIGVNHEHVGEIEVELEARIQAAKKATKEYIEDVNEAIADVTPARLTYQGFKIENPDRMPDEKLKHAFDKIDWLVAFFKRHGMLKLLKETLTKFELWMRHHSAAGQYIIHAKTIKLWRDGLIDRSGKLWKDWVQEVFIHEIGHHIHHYLHAEAWAIWEAPWKDVEQKKRVRDSLSGKDRERFFKLLERQNYNPAAVSKKLKGIDKVKFAQWLRKPLNNQALITPKTFRPTKMGKVVFEFLRDPIEHMRKDLGYTLDAYMGDEKLMQEDLKKKTVGMETRILRNLGLGDYSSMNFPLSRDIMEELRKADPSVEKALEGLGIPSEYGKTNVQEDFAETFVVFMTNPSRLSDSAKFRMQQALAISGLYGKPVGKFASYSDSTLSEVMAGLGMLMAQSVIVTNPMFGEKEIRKYLKLRQAQHDQFAEAIEDLAEAIEEGKFGEAAKTAVRPLQAIGATPAKNAQRALRMTTRAFRGLKNLKRRDAPDADPRIFRLIHMAMRLDPSNDEEYRRPSDEYEGFLSSLLRVKEIPSPVRTLFRKAIKSVKSLPTDTANAGAWFEMKPETQDKLRDLFAKQDEIATAAYEEHKDDPEKMQAVFRETARRKSQIINAAGVNKEIVSRGHQTPKEDLDKVLKRESKLQIDGPTEFVMTKLKESLQEYGVPAQYKGKGIPRELGKVLTQISRARTFDTVKRVIQEAIDRRVIDKSFAETIENLAVRAGKNLALKKGGTLAPLQWSPTTSEEFQERHSAGRVLLDPDMPEDDQKEMLGRVSRAMSDLEGIFGKGFAGKHDRPLDFQFTGSSFGSAASYFGYDKPGQWQPRVRFGDDYEGLLAHELSHFFDDVLATKITLEEDPDTELRNMSRDLFGSTGVNLEYIAGNEHHMKRLSGSVPELGEFVQAVVESEDFERWKDMTSSAHENGVGTAIRQLTGMDIYELPQDHPYKRLYQDMPRMKSDWPPELLEATEKAYKASMDGDDRKLTYFNSGVEVWARMVEQYVYTKLADAGIANPWLTQLTYDLDELPQMMDQENFEATLVPILDRLFARIKERELIANTQRVVERHYFARQLAKTLSSTT